MSSKEEPKTAPPHHDDELLACTYKNTPAASWEGLVVKAKCVKVYDGDTAHFAFRDHQGGGIRRHVCRMVGYNSAELRSKDPHEREAAGKARDRLQEIIGGAVVVTLRCGKNDKYGRLLVEVDCPTGNVREIMLREGHGKPYDGKGPKLF